MWMGSVADVDGIRGRCGPLEIAVGYNLWFVYLTFTVFGPVYHVVYCVS
jgi:hypothetical protein